MSGRHGILAGGNWIVDRLKVIDTYPAQDALANILSESVGNGGCPFNILVDLAKLGARFPLSGVGMIGSDPEGDWISSECRTHGIDDSQVRIQHESRTSYTDVMTVQHTGRRTFFHRRAANAFLGDEHFDFARNTAKRFHLGYLLLLDRLDQPDANFGTVAARILQRAVRAGLKTSIDVVSEDSQRFSAVVLPALPHVDCCFLNELELERTSGLTIRSGDAVDLEAARAGARRLLDAGVREWVIVHFAEGACALSHDGQLHVQGSLCVPQAMVASTVGAGDAFAAGVLLGLHEEASIEVALRYGVCVAASCLLGHGASDGILTLEGCLRLERRFGSRGLRA